MAQLQATSVAGDLSVSTDFVEARTSPTGRTTSPLVTVGLASDIGTDPNSDFGTDSRTEVHASGAIQTDSVFIGDGSELTGVGADDARKLSDADDDVVVDTADNKLTFSTDSTPSEPDTGDTDLTERGRIKNNGVLEWDENVVFNADLTVNGTTTTVSSNELDISDNIIRLNTGQSSVTTESNLTNAGVEVERGDFDDARILWNESANQWEVGTVGATTNIVTDGDDASNLDLTNVTTNDISEPSSPTSSDNLYFTDTRAVDAVEAASSLALQSVTANDLTVSNASTFNGDVTVSGSSLILDGTSDLDVDGTSNFGGDVAFSSGTITISSAGASLSTDELTEGSNNLFFTQDRVFQTLRDGSFSTDSAPADNGVLQAGTGVNFTVDDTNGTITLSTDAGDIQDNFVSIDGDTMEGALVIDSSLGDSVDDPELTVNTGSQFGTGNSRVEIGGTSSSGIIELFDVNSNSNSISGTLEVVDNGSDLARLKADVPETNFTGDVLLTASEDTRMELLESGAIDFYTPNTSGGVHTSTIEQVENTGGDDQINLSATVVNATTDLRVGGTFGIQMSETDNTSVTDIVTSINGTSDDLIVTEGAIAARLTTFRNTSNDSYVDESGDTMSGPLTINTSLGAGEATAITADQDVKINGVLKLQESVTNATTVNDITTSVDNSRNSNDLLITEGALTGFVGNTLNDRYVDESGDTMTGTLAIGASQNAGLAINNDGTGLDLASGLDLYVDNDAEVTGTFTAGNIVETSTMDLKENINTLSGELENLMDLRPVSFDWKDSGEHDLGLIAEEVQEIYPELVHEDSDGVRGINYTKLTSVLIEAVKDMKRELDSLK